VAKAKTKRPPKTRRVLWCCGCNAPVEARLTSGAEIWPHRRDLAERPMWICDTCKNHVGTHWKTERPTSPLGDIPTPELRNARSEVHKILDPLWKYRPDEFPRRRLYAEISARLDLPGGYHTGELRTLDDARRAYRVILDIRREGLPLRVEEPTTTETADADEKPVCQPDAAGDAAR
jgi:zinc-finger-containing domain